MAEVARLYSRADTYFARSHINNTQLNNVVFQLRSPTTLSGKFQDVIKLTDSKERFFLPRIRISVQSEKPDILHGENCITGHQLEMSLHNGLLHGQPAICDGDTKYYYVHGIIHRDDGPAIESPFYKAYYKKGILHRDASEGPAVQKYSDDFLFVENGKLVDGISIISDETRYMTKNGLLHADEGPAVFGGGVEIYAQNGLIHRENGPAATINGAVYYVQNNMIHRKGGPAYIKNKKECWYEHGALHRVDGPAYITPDVHKWYYRGLLHRNDGPAIEYIHNTRKKYYEFGSRRFCYISNEEFPSCLIDHQ